MTRLTLDEVSGAVDAASDVLRYIGVEKALDPLDRRHYLVLVARIERRLTKISGPIEKSTLKAAIQELDVDWPNLSVERQKAVIKAANQAIRGAADKVRPKVDQVFQAEGKKMVDGSRKSTIRRFKLRIDTDLSRGDARVARFIVKSQGHFVTDEFGRRADGVSRIATKIVQDGIERGLGRDDIAESLERKIGAAVLGRSKSYWDVVSSVFSNRARSFAQLSAFSDAAIETFRFESVLDEVTSVQCRFLHGRIFSTEKAIGRFRDVEASNEPQAVKELQPFMQLGNDEDGNQVLYYKSGDTRNVVARVDESAVGRKDEVGRFSRARSSDQLQAAGISVPPLHGRCRSTIIAEG